MIPELVKCGWQIGVAAVNCDGLGLPRNENLLQRMAKYCELRIANPLPAKWLGRLGIRSLALRSGRALDRLVRSWHAEQSFDLVFVSNTEFGLWPLAADWDRDLGLPYVLDWQDPWFTNYYSERPNLVPPGGRLKYGLMRAFAKMREPRVARGAAAHICVSSHYARMLTARYEAIPASLFSLIPFSSGDTDSQNASFVGPSLFRYWAYAGVCGDVMKFSLTALFRAVAKQRAITPNLFQGLKLRFVGTSYATDLRARPSVLPLANACGVQDLVEESTQRIPVDAVREFLMGAEALLIPGTDDPAYVASKLQSCLNIPKPILAIAHADSDMVAALAEQAGVVTCKFSDTGPASMDQLVDQLCRTWLSLPIASLPLAPRRCIASSPASMTSQLVAAFERAISKPSRPIP